MIVYHYNNGLNNMTPDEVDRALAQAEARLRGGAVSYDGADFAAIKSGIDAGWPKDLKDALVATGKAMSAGQPITLKIIMAAVNSVLGKHAAPLRAASKGRNVSAADLRAVAAESGLAWMLNVAPDAKAGGPIEHGGIRIMAKPFMRLGRMVVNVADVGKADVFVYSLYNKELDRAIMIGWIGRDELKACPSGNKDTDEENCGWREMAHYVHFSKLRPMSELLARLKVSKTYDGILMERVPAEADVPVATNMESPSKVDGGKDFWKEIGVDESTIKKES